VLASLGVANVRKVNATHLAERPANHAWVFLLILALCQLKVRDLSKEEHAQEACYRKIEFKMPVFSR
jgi:hypothetical protein